MEYADDWQKIISLDFQDNIEELQKVFDSLTTKKLNQFTDIYIIQYVSRTL